MKDECTCSFRHHLVNKDESNTLMKISGPIRRRITGQLEISWRKGGNEINTGQTVVFLNKIMHMV